MKFKYGIWLLLGIGFLVRLIAFQFDFYFGPDLSAFRAWANQLAHYGIPAFYGLPGHRDQAPVYMYVLALFGHLRNFFEWEFTSTTYTFLLFLPAIISDLAIGYILYKLTSRRFANTDIPLFIAGAWVFNPAVFLVSSVFGQFESVYVLMLFGAIILMRDKKLLPSYILYGVAIMTKPQSLFLAPVFLYYAIQYISSNNFNRKPLLYLFGSIFAGIGAILLVSAPFGIVASINQIVAAGFDIYPRAAVNAFNFWTLMGHNWGSLYQTFLGISFMTWGIIIVAAIIILSITALHIDKSKYDGKYFYLICAALVTCIFLFSIRMHERYFFPAIIFFVAYYAERRDRIAWYTYLGFSVVFFANCLAVLRWINNENDFSMITRWELPFSLAATILGVFLIVYLILLLKKDLNFTNEGFWATKLYKKSFEAETETETPKAVRPPIMKKLDWLAISILILVYSVIAFINLGDRHTPQTTWLPEFGDTVIADFGEYTMLSQLQFLMGGRDHGSFSVMASLDGETWEYVHNVPTAAVFRWFDIDISILARYVRVEATQHDPRHGVRLQEMAFRDIFGELVPIISVTPGGENLFDEQHLVPLYTSFMNSTYFDEIFHPRTGYEYVHGIWVSEISHPPLGKVFMAWSIRVFGMTPFAWRLPGTLFGIMMIPLLYAFARQLLKSNNYAFFASFLFTFDFMLFSQSRLATIDTFVTFFVLAKFFVMYMYVRDVETNSFKKSLILLAACGALMGLSIAVKWQGVYGAIGLPLLFFPALFRLNKVRPKEAVITFYSCFGIFIILPAIIYFLSYIPFMYAQGDGFGGFIRNQEFMFSFHAFLEAGHPFQSEWWSWPFIVRPLWQYASVIVDGTRRTMSTIGSPAVWWVAIISFVYAVYYIIMKRFKEPVLIFLIVGFFVNYLPWAFISRAIFIYHFFPALPFFIIILAWFFQNVIKKYKFAFLYAGLVLALFIFFYPVMSGQAVDVEFVRTWLAWFRHWHFA